MKREVSMFQSISGQCVGNAGMLIWKLLSFAGLFRRLGVLILREKVLPAGFLGIYGLWPEPVHEVEIRAQRGKGIRSTANEHREQAVCGKFLNPGSQAGDTKHNHEDKGTDDLDLIFSRPSSFGIENGKICHNRIEIQETQLFPDRGEFEAEPCALGRIKMYFRLMQEK